MSRSATKDQRLRADYDYRQLESSPWREQNSVSSAEVNAIMKRSGVQSKILARGRTHRPMELWEDLRRQDDRFGCCC